MSVCVCVCVCIHCNMCRLKHREDGYYRVVRVNFQKARPLTCSQKPFSAVMLHDRAKAKLKALK